MLKRITQRIALSMLVAAGASILCGCDSRGSESQPTSFGGDARRGAKVIAQAGCGTCHSIAGIAGARGLVGPPLDNIGDRTIIAGVLPNTPDNMIAWIETPQSVVPGNAMPNMGLGDRDARDVAAYLYTLR
jgi:cytochrome c2